jgi:ankyrin repeat protein
MHLVSNWKNKRIIPVTALDYRYERVNVLRWLLLEENMPSADRNPNGALALHYAAARGCLDCVQLLVQSNTGFRFVSFIPFSMPPDAWLIHFNCALTHSFTYQSST